MDSQVRIRVAKKDLPPASVLLSDTGSLGTGISRTLARLVQTQLGYPAGARLREESIYLSRLVLKGVSDGSGVLDCEPIAPAGFMGKPPAIVSMLELVNGVNHYRATSTWPAYLSPQVRHELGGTLKPVLDTDSDITIGVRENGVWHRCTLDRAMQDALLKPETLMTDTPVDLVGKIYGIDIDNTVFKVDTQSGRVNVKFADDQIDNVDDVRWSRVFVCGIPEDRGYRRFRSMISIRPAKAEEEDGIFPHSENLQLENTLAYKAVAEKMKVLEQLPDKWDSYNAVRPSRMNVEFTLAFLKGAILSLANYGVELPIPDLVPTIAGGFQLEWDVGNRALELEIHEPEKFGFLQIDGNMEKEETASRWEAMRLIRWVTTGEDP